MFFLFSFLALTQLHSENAQQDIFEISAEKSIHQIREELKKHINSDHDSRAIIEIDLNDEKAKGLLCINKNLKNHGQYLGYPRPYYAPLLESEKKDIHFIMTFLANHSLFSLATHKSELEAAGDRIDHIHPLKFFTCVFTSDELKVCIRNIRNNGWVWKDFSGGIKKSLSTESHAENMKKEYVLDFAKKVKLDPKFILHLVEGKKWDEFIDILIAKIPRSSDADRYKD